MTLRQRFEAWHWRSYRKDYTREEIWRYGWLKMKGGEYTDDTTRCEFEAFRAGYLAGRRK